VHFFYEWPTQQKIHMKLALQLELCLSTREGAGKSGMAGIGWYTQGAGLGWAGLGWAGKQGQTHIPE
jgi:hypothetical protein